jgi:hypothetical protein
MNYRRNATIIIARKLNAMIIVRAGRDGQKKSIQKGNVKNVCKKQKGDKGFGLFANEDLKKG